MCPFNILEVKQRFLMMRSLTVEEGDFLAIIGGNGSGKSTLCKTMNGLIPKFYVGEFEGEVVVDGLDASEHDVATFRSRLDMCIKILKISYFVQLY